MVFEDAVRGATPIWPQVHEGEDPNTIDVLLHARQVELDTNTTVPEDVPEPDLGVRAAEAVDAFISGSQFRGWPPETRVERAGVLLERLKVEGLRFGSEAQTYLVALYTWHGCLGMAKLLVQPGI